MRRRSAPRSPQLRKKPRAGDAHPVARRRRRRRSRALRSRAREAARASQWHEYEPLSWDNERVGTQAGVRPPGAPARAPRPRRDDRHDRLRPVRRAPGVRCATAATSRAAAARTARSAIGKMNRLWSVESMFSNTGAMADHRLRAALGARAAVRDGARRRARRRRRRRARSSSRRRRSPTFIKVLAEELKANRGRAVVIAGRRQPPEVHALVAKINQAIGAVGTTLDYVEDPGPRAPDRTSSRSRRSSQDIERRPGRDADHPRRQPGLRRAGRSRLRGGARQGRRRRSTSPSTRTRPR